MKLKEAQSQWVNRAYDIAFAKTKDHAFSTAFASKLLTQTRLNPTHNSDRGVGIAQLSADLDGVDPLNPEEALSFAADRDATIFNETGDLNQAMVGQTANESGPEVAAAELQQIQENEKSVNQSLTTPDSDDEDSSFTEIDSPETRFRRSVNADDRHGTTSVLDEMIDKRVSSNATAR